MDQYPVQGGVEIFLEAQTLPLTMKDQRTNKENWANWRIERKKLKSIC